jgi:hypothetical protein
VSRFSAGLRSAIGSSALSLEEVSTALRERGTPVSASSLSAWQSGLSVPRRRASLAALAELELLLGLAPGSLEGLLPGGDERGRPGFTADQAWENPAAVARVLAKLEAVPDDPGDPEKLSQRLTLRMDERGDMRSLTLVTLIRARRDGTHRIISISSDDEIQDAPRVVTARGARVGRFRADPTTGYSAYEVLLPTAIDRGELALVEYSEYYRAGVDGQLLGAAIGRGALDTALTVEFHPERLPAECAAYYQQSTTVEPRRLTSFAAGRPWARLVRSEPEPGIYSITWSWR